MRVIVDGVIYGRQRYGGINTYFNQVLPRLATRYGAVVDVFLPNTPRGTPPRPPVRCHPRDLIPTRTGLSWRLDERLHPVLDYVNLGLITLWGRAHTRALFHSTYFTSPPVPLPHVAMVHDLNHEIFPHAYSGAWGWVREQYPIYLRGATRIIAVSNTTKAHAIDLYGISPSLIDVVYHAVDPEVFFVDRRGESLVTLRDRLGIRVPYVLYVGIRGAAYKNFDALLHALAGRTDLAELSLVVAGAPWSERERAQIHRLGLGPTVRLIEYPDDDTLRMLYSFSEAFVYPSLNEGFGIPLLEAMACGTPVVAADTPVFREVAGEAAIYFDPRDPEKLARAIDTCLDEATRREYSARGFRQLVGYSWDKSAADTYAAYQKALA